jgi:hypothetical protein
MVAPAPQPAPQPTPASEAPKETPVVAPTPEPKQEEKGAEKTYATWGNKPIAVRCADAEKWKPEGELEEKAQASGLAMARRLGVPKERQALFAMNFTTLLTKPDEFRKYDKAAKEIKSGDDQHAGAAMLAMLGYTGKPIIVDEATFRADPGKVTYSGISTTGRSSQTIQQKLATLYAGDVPRYGHNMFGVAFYSGNKSTAATYATQGGSDNAVFRVKMREPDNVYQSQSQVMLASDIIAADARADHGKYALDHPDYKMREIMDEAGYTTDEMSSFTRILFGDNGNTTKSITPALAGYDAYYDRSREYRMVLNRGALILPDTYVSGVSGVSSFGPDGATSGSRAMNVSVDVAHVLQTSASSDKVEKGDVLGHPFHGNQYGIGLDGEKRLEESPEEINQVISDLSLKMNIPANVVGKAIRIIAQPLVEARKNEPEITRNVNEIAALSGGKKERETFAVKSLKSASEKTIKDTVERFHDKSAIHMERVAKNIHDLVRYTITWPEDKIAQGAQQAIDAFRARGFMPYVVNGEPALKNYFHAEPGNSYRGINCNFVDPNNGQIFEVQFHTPASLDMAEKMHDEYDRVRKLDTKSKEYAKGQAYLNRQFAKVPIPPGIESVGRITFKKLIGW